MWTLAGCAPKAQALAPAASSRTGTSGSSSRTASQWAWTMDSTPLLMCHTVEARRRPARPARRPRPTNRGMTCVQCPHRRGRAPRPGTPTREFGDKAATKGDRGREQTPRPASCHGDVRIASSNDPVATMSSNVMTRFANLRTVITGPSSASGGMITCTRCPSGSRAFTMGEASSMRRPNGPSTRPMSGAQLAFVGESCSPDAAGRRGLKNTSEGLFTAISVTESSASSDSSGPNPNTMSMSPSVSRCCSRWETPAQEASSNAWRHAPTRCGRGWAVRP